MSRMKSNTWKIYLLSVISFLTGTLQFIIGGILDKIAVSTGVSVSTAGQLGTAFSLASAIGTPIVIMMTAKLNLRKQLLMGLTVILLSSFTTVLIPGFGFLLISRILLGIGTGVFIVNSYSIVAKLAQPERQARALSNLAMGSSMALVIGVPIGRNVAITYGWKSIFWVIGFLILLSIFVVIMTIQTTETQAPISLSHQLSYLKKPKITMPLGTVLLMFISYSIVNSFITPLLISLMPKIEEKLSIILFGLGVASLVGSKLGGSLADRIGASRTLIGGMVIQSGALILITILPRTELIIIPLLMIWSVAAWICGPMFNFYLISVAPEAANIMLSLNSTSIQLGFAVGAVIGGVVLNEFSIIAIGWSGAAVGMLATCVWIFSLRISRSPYKIASNNKKLDME